MSALNLEMILIFWPEVESKRQIYSPGLFPECSLGKGFQMSEFKRLKFDAQGISPGFFPGYPGGKGFQIGIQASTKIIPVSTPATVPTTEEVLVLFNDFKLSPNLLTL